MSDEQLEAGKGIYHIRVQGSLDRKPSTTYWARSGARE